MRRKLNKIAKWSSLLLFWFIVNGNLTTRTILTGITMVTVAMMTSSLLLNKVEEDHVHVRYFWRIIWFSCLVAVDLIPAAYHHIIRVIAGSDQSWIFEVDLDVTDDFQITLIANAITLTPGTMTVMAQGQTLTIVGFANSPEEVVSIRHGIQTRMQKPFLRG